MLIVGIGNELLGDEGLGVHVARSLAARRHLLPPGVEVVEAGTALLDVVGDFVRYPRVIIVDAVRAGRKPGTVYRFELDPRLLGQEGPMAVSLHEFGVQETLHAAALAGLLPASVQLVGAEPGRMRPGIELSPALVRAKRRIEALLRADVGPPVGSHGQRPPARSAAGI